MVVSSIKDFQREKSSSISSFLGDWFYSSDKHCYTMAGLASDEQLLLRFDEIDRVHSLWLLRKCTDEVSIFPSRQKNFEIHYIHRLKRIVIKQLT